MTRRTFSGAARSTLGGCHEAAFRGPEILVAGIQGPQSRVCATTVESRAMADFETVLYEETDGVAWVTMNRPSGLE